MITAKYDGTVYAAKELEKRRFVKNGIMDQKVDQEMRIMSSIKHVSPSSIVVAYVNDSNVSLAKYCPIYRACGLGKIGRAHV